MWNPKRNDINELTKQKETHRLWEWTHGWWGKRMGRAVWDGHVLMLYLKLITNKDHMELCSIICGSLDGRRICRRTNVCIVAVVQLLSHVRLFASPWTAALQASLTFTISQSLLKLMYIESVMPSNHLISVILFFSCPEYFPASRSFQWVVSSHQVAKVLELQLQHQSFQWIFRIDFL